jgi:ribosomal protein S12 methylthiotransferase accessory factor
VAGALLFDEHRGPIPLVAGYACRARREEALLGALLEAAQSRATQIHGARDDIAVGRVEEGQALFALLEAHRARRAVRAMPDAPRLSTSTLIARFRKRFPRAMAVDLSPAKAPWHVVKVLAPSMQVSELLR